LKAAVTEAAKLYEQNLAVRNNAPMRLLGAQHVATYLTLMERHLDHGTKVAESDLISRFEADLESMGGATRTDDPNPAAMLARWAAAGWLYRLPDTSGATVRTICHLTPEALAVLKFARSLRREDTVATGGSMASIASALREVAAKVNNDPNQIRADIEARIQHLYDELDELERGERPAPDIIDIEDEASAVALQMEQVIANIGQYGVIANRITRQLIDPDESDQGYRQRQQRLFDDHDSMFASREFASYTAFTRMVQDPEPRKRLTADIGVVTENLPGLDPELRAVLSRFFELVQQQTAEVGRIQQRCAQRIKRFVAAGTLEQHRGLARQLNKAIDAATDVLRKSLADSGVAMPIPLAPAAVTSVGVLDFTIVDPAPPEPVDAAEPQLDEWALAELAAQVDAPKLAGLVNRSVDTWGEISLPTVISMLDDPGLGDIVVLWSWALNQPQAGGCRDTSARPADTEIILFRSRENGCTQRSVRIPALTFRQPIPLELEATA
jgi:hypothetical protein